MSESVEDACDFAQVKMTREDWEKLLFSEQRLHVLVSGCGAPAAIEKHTRFFLPAVNIFFLVSNTLYSVSRAPFERHSSEFTGKGLTEDDPFILADVEVAHFDHFLSILYPSEYGMYTATTVDEWTAILHFAVKWGFGSIRTLSIKHLAPIATDIDKIVLGRQYAIDEWLADAYFAVCMREQSLTEEEGARMKVADIIKINSVRQRFGLGSRPEAALPLSIGDVGTYFDISQSGVSQPTGSERAAHGPTITSDLDVTPHLAPSEQHTMPSTDLGARQSELDMYGTLNQSDQTPSTSGIDTPAPPESTPSEVAISAEKAQEVAALERAEREKEITERAFEAFFESHSNHLASKSLNMERIRLRAVAIVMQAELTNTVDPRKQKVLDYIASYKAENSALH
ncbi:hypothetical protein FIBSPDRAFT_881328 [Athelia psychrophila]|uniref:BTB domain-containing protein n=1 Tax=Athelia psychrophila TaxID=1759441 RepID=A0A166WJ53_9AGAM|nr:hypothetical protein FIBSPDRAFT_881328 [Fibularhizoctonia sp. CBS 109695]